jgi:hypothetical protein
MIALLGKHLRKWLLGLALAARNQAQAVAAQLESAETDKAKAADREVAPRAAKTARSGQPPAHWVQLVKRHAPELLQPGPPYTAPRASQVFEPDAGGDESAGADTHDPASANGELNADEAETHEDPAFSLKLPQLSREHDDPPGRWPPPAEKNQTRDSDKSPEAAARRPRDDAAPHAPEATPAESVNVHRNAASGAGAEKRTPRRFLGLQPKASSVYPGVPGPGTRKAETPVARASAAPRPPSADGHIEKKRPGKRAVKNIQPDSGENFQPPGRTGLDVVPFEQQADDRQTGFRVAARTLVPPATKQDAANESRPRPSESSRGLQSSADSAVKTSAAPIIRSGDDRRPVNEGRLINGQRPAHPPEDRVKVDEKRSRPPVFHWPNLPGEKSSEDAGDSSLGATWPSLPEAPSAAAETFRHQPELSPSEAELRNIERLRRLDEEQRGIPWSALHF